MREIERGASSAVGTCGNALTAAVSISMPLDCLVAPRVLIRALLSCASNPGTRWSAGANSDDKEGETDVGRVDAAGRAVMREHATRNRAGRRDERTDRRIGGPFRVGDAMT